MIWSGLLAVAALAQSRLQTIDVDEIQPGMRGYGLTVFRGTRPERFEVEVIDVLHNFQPDQDLILIRTHHPILETAVAVGGMSGSPVYLDGRLAGAYAYGWPFGLEPVVGVTPIASMLAEMHLPLRERAFPPATVFPKTRAARGSAVETTPAAETIPAAETKRAAHSKRSELRDRSFSRTDLFAAYDGRRMAAGDRLRDLKRIRHPRGEFDPQPAKTPLMIGGMNPTAVRLLREELGPFGLEPLQAGGGATESVTAAPFENGGAIGVQLIRGDLSATAVGTVTFVGDQRLIAFGHPMLQAGQVGLPTATARVLHILASRSRSFKIAEALSSQGTLIHDRQAGIVVDSHRTAATVSLRIRMPGLAAVPRNEWKVEIASHRALTPVLVLAALSNAVSATASDRTEVTFRAETRVKVFGETDFTALEDEGMMQDGPSESRVLSRLRLFQVIDAAYGNPFRRSWPQSIEIDLFFKFAREVEEIVDVRVARSEVDPGETVSLQVQLQRKDAERRLVTLPIRVPPGSAGSTLEVKIQGGHEVSRPQPIAQSLGQLLDQIQDYVPARSLVASVQRPTRGLRYRGQIVDSLPASALDTLQFTTEGGSVRPFVTQMHYIQPNEYLLTGAAYLTLHVREKPKVAP